MHSSTAINGTWRAPANSQLLTYYIKYSSLLTNSYTLTTRATALALTGLHPHEQYNISVQARNRAGLSLPVYATAKTYSDSESLCSNYYMHKQQFTDKYIVVYNSSVDKSLVT